MEEFNLDILFWQDCGWQWICWCYHWKVGADNQKHHTTEPSQVCKIYLYIHDRKEQNTAKSVVDTNTDPSDTPKENTEDANWRCKESSPGLDLWSMLQLFWSLHWLPISRCIDYKILSLTISACMVLHRNVSKSWLVHMCRCRLHGQDRISDLVGMPTWNGLKQIRQKGCPETVD